MTDNAKILIVDDDPDTLRVQAILLERAGYHVLQASTGQEGLRVARDARPDLILLDVVLPDVGGLEICRRVKADPALDQTFVVLLSGLRTGSEEQAAGLEAGADGTIARPMGNRELLARIEAFLRIRRAEERLRASEARYRDVFENAPIGIYRTTPQGEILMANPALVDMLGYDSFEKLAQRDLESEGYHPDYPRAAFKERVEEEGRVRGLEAAWRRKDGSTLFVRENARAIHDEHGRLVGYQGTVEDVTERVQRTRRLERLNTVLDAIGEINQLIVREQDRDRLITDTCQRLVQTDAYRTARIALLGEDGTPTHVAGAGPGDRQPTLAEEGPESALAPCVAEALSEPGVWVGEAPEDCQLADVYGDDTLMATRLEHAGAVYGLTTVSLPRSIEIDEREKALFQEMAGDIAFALHDIELEEEHRRADRALEESEERYRRHFENVSDVIYSIDRDLKLIDVSPSVEGLLGYRPEELIGKTFSDLNVLAPEFMEQALSDTLRVMKGGEVTSSVYQFITRDGSRVWGEVSGAPIMRDGEVVALVSVARDITEQKEAQEALRRSREALAALNAIARKVNQSLDLQEVLDTALEQTLDLLGAEGGLIYLFEEESQQFVPTVHRGISEDVVSEVTGFRMGEGLSGRAAQTGEALVVADLAADPRNLSPTAAREGWHAYAGIPVRSGERILGVMTVIAAEVGLFSSERVNLLNRLGDQIGVAMQNARLYEAAQQEISARKKAEEERKRLLERTRQQAQRLQQTIDTVPEGVLLLDANHKVILSNPVAEKDLDVLAQAGIGDVLTQLGGRTIEELLTPPPSARAWHEVEADDRSFEIIARRMTISGGQERWVMVINDTTIEKQVQKQLRQQERLAAVGQLAGGIAHDFNNILAAIILYAQMPLSRQDLAPRTAYALETILEESHRAADLVQQILDFSRSAMMETKPVSLATLVQETTTLLRRTIPENIRLVMGVTSHPCIVQADATRIHQALMNLALNAKDAMPEGGELRIQVARVALEEGEGPPEMPAGAYARLTVADTGTGMSEEAQEHLFEPFFTTKEVGEGTGLGLAQVHGIVKQHQGFIDVETAEGEGTTFTIFLPLAEDEEEDHGAEEEQEIPLQDRSETILVVEDAERLRGAIRAGLDALGYRVLAAANGREALEMLSQEEVDVVLTDVVMPEMGGKALLDRLRAAEPGLKVIAMTGHVVEKDVEKLQRVGFEAALPKPFSIEELERVVRGVLE